MSSVYSANSVNNILYNIIYLVGILQHMKKCIHYPSMKLSGIMFIGVNS